MASKFDHRQLVSGKVVRISQMQSESCSAFREMFRKCCSPHGYLNATMKRAVRYRSRPLLLFTSAVTLLFLIWLHAVYQGSADSGYIWPATSSLSGHDYVSRRAQYLHNTMEDVMLQQYISSEKLATKGVIVYLAHTVRVKLLIEAISELHEQFNHRFRYPVIIFHEADFLPMVDVVRKIGFNLEGNSFNIFFQHVNLDVPDWFLKKFGQPPLLSCNKRTIGYRSMCRFHAKLLYEQHVLRHFEYIWRLDDDSKINSKIDFDVFARLKDNGKSYGFLLSSIDDCAHNIYNVTMDYMKAKGITPTFMDAMQPNEIFLNNFEISSTKFWLSKEYQDFIEHIDSLGGIYLHRWGDAPIKTLALRMHVPLREIYRFKTISYSHHGNKKLFTNFLG